MQHPSIDGLINPDEDLLVGLGGLATHRGVTRGMGLLVGALRGATVRPAPDATPVVLTAPTWLVQGTASFDGDQVSVHGVISWVDQGLPRMVAGQIEAARSGGVRVQLLPTALADASAIDAPAPRTARNARSRKAAAASPSTSKPAAKTATKTAAKTTAKATAKATPKRPAKKAGPADQLDLSETAAELDAKPAKGGWGAAVAASKTTPSRASAPSAPTPSRSTPNTRTPSTSAPRKSGGGWGAAVAASQSRDRAGRPSPDELGFDAPPAFMAGDVVLHPRFGRCIVSRMIGKSKVKLRRPSGGLFDLHLKVCAFVREPDEDDKRVFSMTIRR